MRQKNILRRPSCLLGHIFILCIFFLLTLFTEGFDLLYDKADNLTYRPHNAVDSKTVDQAEKHNHIDLFHKFI